MYRFTLRRSSLRRNAKQQALFFDSWVRILFQYFLMLCSEFHSTTRCVVTHTGFRMRLWVTELRMASMQSAVGPACQKSTWLALRIRDSNRQIAIRSVCPCKSPTSTSIDHLKLSRTALHVFQTGHGLF